MKSVPKKSIISFGIVLFLVLAGTGTAAALWSSQGTTSATVSAATMGISQSGFDALSVDYTSSSLSEVAPVTVTNTGTVTSTFTLLMRSTSTSGIASAKVQTAVVTSAANCTTSTSFASTTNTWKTVPALSATLTAGASTIYCVKTSLTSTQFSSTIGQSIAATATLSSVSTQANDSWSASAATVTATQTSKDTSAPTRPGTPALSGTTPTSTVITWGASTDNVGVTAYDLYRNGTLVQAGVTSPYTDATLTRSTSYTFTITARDAAGNTSAASSGATVKTPIVDSTIWLSVKASTGSTKCVDASGGGTGNGTGLLMYDCNDGANQAWNFVLVDTDTYRVAAAHVTTSGWAVPQWGGGAAQLWSYSNSPSTSEWTVRNVGTTGTLYQFVNTSTNRCLTMSGAASTNPSLTATTCSTTSVAGPQVFTLTAAR